MRWTVHEVKCEMGIWKKRGNSDAVHIKFIQVVKWPIFEYFQTEGEDEWNVHIYYACMKCIMDEI